METKDLEVLRGKLPRNYVSEIYNKLLSKKNIRLSKPQIRKVIMGTHENLDVVDIAIEVAAEYQQKLQEQRKKIQELQ